MQSETTTRVRVYRAAPLSSRGISTIRRPAGELQMRRLDDNASNHEEYHTNATVQVTIQPPGAVSGLDPESGALGVVETPILRWQQVDKATAYDLYLWPKSCCTTYWAVESNASTSE